MINELFAPQDVLRNLYVYPNYAVLIPPPLSGSRAKTENRIKNESNLKQNRTKGVLSEKARKRLVNSINWLLLASKKKRVYCNKSGKWVSFRISFITLTVPTTEHNLSDEFFKKKVLHNFLSNMYTQFGMRNYVWKVERNKNGNIHFHLTSDCYVHHTAVRQAWNSALSKFGIIDLYAKKFSQMSFEEYSQYRISNGNDNVKNLRSAFDFGYKTNWREPNSTDVHSVKNIRDLGAYLADYMSKKEEGKEPINGRIWGCSHSLSAGTKNETEVILSHDPHIEKDLFSENVEQRDIVVKDSRGVVVRKVGQLFFWKLSQIDKDINGGLRDIIADIVARIRSPKSELVFT